jgi:hypothetical protein
VRLKSRNAVFVLYKFCILTGSVDFCELRGHSTSRHVLSFQSRQRQPYWNLVYAEPHTPRVSVKFAKAQCGCWKAQLSFRTGLSLVHWTHIVTLRAQYSKATELPNVPSLWTNCVVTAVIEVWEWRSGSFSVFCVAADLVVHVTQFLSLPPPPQAKGPEGANRRFLRKAGNLIIYETRQIVC